MINFAAEHAEHLPFWQDTWAVLTDPAHIAAEIIFSIVIDVLIVGVLWQWLIKGYLSRRLDRLHRELDQEHGIEHDQGDDDERD